MQKSRGCRAWSITARVRRVERERLFAEHGAAAGETGQAVVPMPDMGSGHVDDVNVGSLRAHPLSWARLAPNSVAKTKARSSPREPTADRLAREESKVFGECPRHHSRAQDTPA